MIRAEVGVEGGEGSGDDNGESGTRIRMAES